MPDTNKETNAHKTTETTKENPELKKDLGIKSAIKYNSHNATQQVKENKEPGESQELTKSKETVYESMGGSMSKSDETRYHSVGMINSNPNLDDITLTKSKHNYDPGNKEQQPKKTQELTNNRKTVYQSTKSRQDVKGTSLSNSSVDTGKATRDTEKETLSKSSVDKYKSTSSVEQREFDPSKHALNPLNVGNHKSFDLKPKSGVEYPEFDPSKYPSMTDKERKKVRELMKIVVESGVKEELQTQKKFNNDLQFNNSPVHSKKSMEI